MTRNKRFLSFGRALNKIYAKLNGYFWAECPVCYRWYGGHEANGVGLNKDYAECKTMPPNKNGKYPRIVYGSICTCGFNGCDSVATRLNHERDELENRGEFYFTYGGKDGPGTHIHELPRTKEKN